MTKETLLAKIRLIENYPKEGILFRDITTLLGDAEGFACVIEHFKERYKASGLDYIVGIEARGFILGSALAYALGVGFVPIRKRGKLPWHTRSKSYALEYGEDEVEIHSDAFGKGARVLLVDDLIATGGTALAAVELIEELGGKCVGACFLMDLVDLGGSRVLRERSEVYSLFEI